MTILKGFASCKSLQLLKEMVEFHSTISRHGIARTSSALLIWLNQMVGFHPTIFRHGIARTSSALLIWLNQMVTL